MRSMFVKTSVLIFLAVLLMAASCKAPEPIGNVNDPSNFQANAAGETQVNLSWTAVTEATGYSLERKAEGGSYAVVASPDKTATSYSDKTVEAGKSYSYLLKTVRDGQKSQGVEFKVTLPLPGTPFNVTTLEPIWFSKQARNGTPSDEALALNAVTETGTSLTFTGNAEALYSLGSLCTKFSASVTGSGKVFAGDVELWSGAGNTGNLSLIGKQQLSLISIGNATWTTPVVTCSSKPAAPVSSYIGGKWSEPFKWGTSATGLVATHAANLPDGRIVSWSAWKELAFGIVDTGFEVNSQGYIWTPSSGTGPTSFVEKDNPSHDMFCAGLALLPDGRVFGGGGGTDSSSSQPDSQNFTSYFNFKTNTWERGQNLHAKHWYGTAIAIPDNTPDGKLLMIGGSSGNSTTEILENTGTFGSNPGVWNNPGDASSVYAELANINVGSNYSIAGTPVNQVELAEVQQWYPHLTVAPDGKLIQTGPVPEIKTLTVGSNGVSATPTGVPSSHALMRTFGNSIMFAEGKILVTGGSVVRGMGATKTALIININGNVTPELIPDMRFRRTFHNAVVLPTGDVMVMGGNNSGKQFMDTGKYTEPKSDPKNANGLWPSDISTESVLTAELFSPDKKLWRDLTDASVPRNYHSVGLLLQDGTVLSAGGGLCGELCTRNHPDAQVYSPGYLFNADGTPAQRPVIGTLGAGSNTNADVPGTYDITYGTKFNVTITDLGNGTKISKFSMIKLSAVTHSINTDLRYLEYSAEKGNLTGSDKNYQLTTTSKNTILTPGYYFLFAVNDKGVPSVAKVVQVQ